MKSSIAVAVLAGVALMAAGGFITATAALAANAEQGAQVTPVFSAALPNVPGNAITAVVVSYGPGGKSPEHHHAGSVLAYVLSGAIRSENSATGPVKVYHAGEAFFEPAGSEHLISENASSTEPASLLAIFVAKQGASLTTIDK